jgi:hypothetical protein
MFNRSKQEATLDYAANGFEAEEMSRGGLVHAYLCKLDGQLTVAGASNTRANTLRGDALAVIDRLRVRLNSQENVYDMDGPGILMDNYYLLGDLPRDVDGQLGDGATLNPTFSVNFVIAFTIPRRKIGIPIDTALDLRANRVSKAEIEVDWKTHTAINSAATGFTVNPKITVRSLKAFDAPDSFLPGFLRRYKIQQTLTASNPREIIRLPTTFAYEGIMLNSIVSSIDNAAVFNKIRLVSGSTVFEDHDPELLQDAFGRLWMGRHRAYGFGTTNTTQHQYFSGQVSNQFDHDGWYPIEIPYDGNLREVQVASQLAELLLELDCTIGGGTTVLSAYPYQYVPPPARMA